jgi:hypothetical protein
MALVRHHGIVVLAARTRNSVINKAISRTGERELNLPCKPILLIQALIGELVQPVQVDAFDMLAHGALDQLRIRTGRSSQVRLSTHDENQQNRTGERRNWRVGICSADKRQLNSKNSNTIARTKSMLWYVMACYVSRFWGGTEGGRRSLEYDVAPRL